MVYSGAVLDMASHSDTINGLSGAGTVDNTTASTTSVLTVGGDDADCDFNGTIQNSAGTLCLAKTGAGTLSLSGTNTYTGSTAVGAGVLEVADTGSLTSDTTVSGGEFRFVGNAELAGDLTVGASGRVVFDGGGTIIGNAMITGDAVFASTGVICVTETLTLSGGVNETSTLAAGQTLVTPRLNVERILVLDGGTLDLDDGVIVMDFFDYNGRGSGTGHIRSGTIRNVDEVAILLEDQQSLYPAVLVKEGPDTLLLDGENTYTRETLVEAGIPVATTPDALPGYDSAGMVVVSSGGAVGGRIGGDGWSEAQIETLRANVDWDTSGAALVLDTTNGDYTYENDLVDPDGTHSIGLTKTGAGTLQLTGDRSYTGDTTVLGGTLLAGAMPSVFVPVDITVFNDRPDALRIANIGNSSGSFLLTLGGACRTEI